MIISPLNLSATSTIMISSSGHQSHPIIQSSLSITILYHHDLMFRSCSSHYLRVYPGPDLAAPPIHQFCGVTYHHIADVLVFSPLLPLECPAVPNQSCIFLYCSKRGIKPLLKNVLIHKYSEIKRTIINQIQINEGGGGGGSKAAELVHIPSILPPISLYFVILYSFLNTPMDKKNMFGGDG